MYDKMGPLGAHEVVVETPSHEKRMTHFSDEEIERVLWVWGARIADLKKDSRFKYVSVFKNHGVAAGEEWPHAHSEVTATIFVPRRIKYELHASHDWFKDKERWIFCDVVRQEEKQGKRIVDVQADYYALCPYAPRVPYEVWVMHRKHNQLFGSPGRARTVSNWRPCSAACAGWTESRQRIIRSCTPPPTPKARKANERATGKRWRTTITGTSKSCRSLKKRSKSYSIKEVYFNAELPEQAAAHLRSLDPDS